MRSARYLIVLLIMMLVPAIVSASPIPPQPLHKLTKESDLIVIARVIEITERKNRTDSDFASAIARLQISSVVKGSFSDEFVEVPYPADLICPAPPHAAAANGRVVCSLCRRTCYPMRRNVWVDGNALAEDAGRCGEGRINRSNSR